jgi:hypothetical protein
MVLDVRTMKVDAVVLWCIIDGEIKEAWDIPAIHNSKVIES